MGIPLKRFLQLVKHFITKNKSLLVLSDIILKFQNSLDKKSFNLFKTNILTRFYCNLINQLQTPVSRFYCILINQLQFSIFFSKYIKDFHAC